MTGCEWAGAQEAPREAQPECAERMAAQTAEMCEFMEYDEPCSEGIRFTEGSLDERGRYIPGQVQEVDAEAAEFDPELSELKLELESWIRQGERMSCAVAGQTMAVNQLERAKHSESELLELGKRNRWYDEGTCPEDVGKIAQAMGEEVRQLEGVAASELVLANDPEVKVLANVDSTLLRYPESGRRCMPNHVVQVLRVERTEQGEVVILNDPGCDEGRGAVYAMDVFEKAYRGDITIIRKGAMA